MSQNILVGAHISIAGGFHKAIERAEMIGATAIQVFTKSSRSWFAKPITKDEIERFKTAWKESNVDIVVAHASYLINIGSPNKKTASGSRKSLKSELSRCEKLGIPYLIIHPGSHLGIGESECIEQIAHNLDDVLEHSNTKILLETMAGQGTNVGHTFEQLKKIRQLVTQKRKIGFCLDTCHIFSAGYDIRTAPAYHDVMKQFSKILGLRNLKVIHINDSKEPFNAHKDRHEELGKGKIPLSVMKAIMNDKKLQNVPKILETPAPGLEGYAKEIKMLKKMVTS